ncbi:MAG: 2-succinyl-5-enolpyruvyl-6-hydroxy-3-cyclohexene-1-carboxylic-acid synthase [Nakamurella sp.]
MNPSTAIAEVVVDELIANGVTDAVLSPGSRNAPLSMALHRADRDGRLRLHVRIDERTAGFLALGLARTTGRPVPVVTTSGTAVANLHPAVAEADLIGVPLLVISADRPAWLRDVGENQTIDQVRLFGSSLRFFHEFETSTAVAGQNARWRSMVCRALAHATGAGGRPGPVQLNLCLAEPLLPDAGSAGGPAEWPEPLTGRGGPWTVIGAETAEPAPGIPAPQPGERVLVVADLMHPGAAALAAVGHLVISEAGGAAGAGVLAAGGHLLAHAEFIKVNRPDRVIVLGRPTLSRPVSALLGDPAVHVDVVGSAVGWRGANGNVRRLAPTLAAGVAPVPDDWSQLWRTADQTAAAAVARVSDRSPLAASPVLARELVGGLADGTLLVVGSSQPVRDLGAASRARDGLRVLANRGAAGIDGTISTAIGAALAHRGPAVAYLGDLTFLHDVTGLVIGAQEPRPDLTIVVSNNDGGGIFGILESGLPQHSDAFERVFGTPHGADLGAFVRGAGHRHRAVDNRAELSASLSAVPDGIEVIEVRTDRIALPALLAELKSAVAGALR